MVDIVLVVGVVDIVVVVAGVVECQRMAVGLRTCTLFQLKTNYRCHNGSIMKAYIKPYLVERLGTRWLARPIHNNLCLGTNNKTVER